MKVEVFRKAEVTPQGVTIYFVGGEKILPVAPFFGGELTPRHAEEFAEFLGVTAEDIKKIFDSPNRPWWPLGEDVRVTEYFLHCPSSKGAIKEVTEAVISGLRQLKREAEKASLKGWLREEMKFEI